MNTDAICWRRQSCVHQKNNSIKCAAEDETLKAHSLLLSHRGKSSPQAATPSRVCGEADRSVVIGVRARATP